VHATREHIGEAFCNNFNTQEALTQFFNLVTETNKYFTDHTHVNYYVYKAIESISTTFLNSLGLLKGSGVLSYLGNETTSNNSATEKIMDNVVNFRKEVRNQAIKDKNTDVLDRCDAFRKEMCTFGIRIQDSNEDSRWSFEDRETLLKEAEEKEKNEIAKNKRKMEAEEEKRKKKEEKDRKRKINPLEMFKADPE